MERGEGFYSRILRLTGSRICVAVVAAMALTASCVSPGLSPDSPDRDLRRGLSGEEEWTYIHFTDNGMAVASASCTKTDDPDEDIISDANLIVVDEFGDVDRCEYIDDVSTGQCRIKLVSKRTYSIYACCNFGYRMSVGSTESLRNLCCHLAYPDDYRKGIPMVGVAENVSAGDDTGIELTRLMAKISLRMDRSALDGGVEMNVTGVKIGNCPRRALIFSPWFGNRKEMDEDWFFPSGFSRNAEECGPLNLNRNGTSGMVSLYMLENPDSDSSWLEMALDYKSAQLYSFGTPLVYRLRMGSDGDCDIERNRHYNITVRPIGDGLGKEGWCIDKSGLSSQTRFSMKPDGYLEVDVGDRIHVRCEFYPPDAPFSINRDNLENDRETGIYTYSIDEDGHGVVLDIVGYGAGMVYMEAGEPINDAGLLYIHVRDDRT